MCDMKLSCPCCWLSGCYGGATTNTFAVGSTCCRQQADSRRCVRKAIPLTCPCDAGGARLSCTSRCCSRESPARASEAVAQNHDIYGQAMRRAGVHLHLSQAPPAAGPNNTSKRSSAPTCHRVHAAMRAVHAAVGFLHAASPVGQVLCTSWRILHGCGVVRKPSCILSRVCVDVHVLWGTPQCYAWALL